MNARLPDDFHLPEQATAPDPTASTPPAAASAPTPPSASRLDRDDPRARALARLSASRLQLQATWLPPARERGGEGRGGRRLGALWRRWRRQLGDVGQHPLLGMALQAVDGWWQANPWRGAGEAVAGELQHSLTPLVRRHPAVAIGLAAGAGALVAGLRPWRWPLVAEQLRPLPRRVGRWLLRQLGQAPIQSLITSLVLAGGATAAAANAAADSEPAPGEPRAPHD